MRAFWTIFFLGSMLLVGIDTLERRDTDRTTFAQPVAGDPMGIPTPNP